MICDDCKRRDKCNKIISESATYCPDRGWYFADTSKTVKMLTKVLQSYEIHTAMEDTIFRIDKDYLETGYVRYGKCTEWSPKDFLKEYNVTWR